MDIRSLDQGQAERNRGFSQMRQIDADYLLLSAAFVKLRGSIRFNYLLATDGHPDLRNSSFKRAIVVSTSSSLRGIAADMFTGSPEVTRTSSSMRTPTPLYFSKAGRTALMNRSFSGVFGKTSRASGRI